MTAELFNKAELQASLLRGGEEAHEKTAAGSLIGCVRDLVQGEAKTLDEKQSRARSNDMLGEVAADTVAMMPGVGRLNAGLIRAGMMTDLHKGLADNAVGTLKNFAEGVALNSVSRIGGGALHDPLMSRSLLAESTGLFKLGAGMGTVKAAFNEQTWKDKDGQFSFGDGLSNVAKACTIGGVIGVPAGLVGNRLAQLGLTHLAERGLSERAMSIGLGSISGYSAGAVFGGVDAGMQGGGVKDILSAAHESGLMGMFAGGLTGGFAKNETASRLADNIRSHNERDPRLFETGEWQIPARHADAGKRFVSERMSEYAQNLEMQQPRDLVENLSRLGDWSRGKIVYEKAVPNSHVIAARAESYEEYWRQARTYCSEQSRIYRINGVEVHVPESYARQLDTVYDLRILQEKGFAPGATERARMLGEQAREQLQQHPMKDRAHPADFLQAEQLPDISIARRFELLNSNYFGDAWTSKTYKAGFVTGGTADPSGVITFYKIDANVELNRLLHHEWAHLLANNAVREMAVYGSAAELETFSHNNRAENGFSVSEYANRNLDENWAEHSAAITKADPTEFFLTAAEAPIRTAVIGKALAKSLAAVPSSQRSPFIEQLSGRVSYINEHVLPRAQSLLSDYVQHGSPQEQINAAKLLREVGGKPEFEVLKEVASLSKNASVAHAAFDAAREMSFYGREVFSGYQSTKPSESPSYVDFLLQMAQPGNRARAYALQYLEPRTDSRSVGWYNLLTHEQVAYNPQKQISMLYEAMRRIPESEGRERAYDAARRLTGPDPGKQFSLAVGVYQQVPALREQALRQMISIDAAKAEPILRDLARKPTHRLNALAKEGLSEIEALVRHRQLQGRVETASWPERARVIQELGERHEVRGIEPLLQRFAKGLPEEKELVLKALGNYNWQLVKAEVHRLQRMDPRWVMALRPIIDARPGAH